MKLKHLNIIKNQLKKEYLNEIYIIGCCYENEIGTEIDKEKVVELYKDAANRGNKDVAKKTRNDEFIILHSLISLIIFL
jgi:TPR repeat protein